MQALLKIGKFLLAIPMLVFGAFHFMGAENMAGMVPLPGGVIWVYITGIALILAAIAIMIGKFDRLATFLLGLMLLIFALSIHLPGIMNAADEMAGQMAMISFLKDVAIAGGSWIYAAYAARDHSILS